MKCRILKAAIAGIAIAQFHFGHDDDDDDQDSDSVPTGCFAANWQDNCAVAVQTDFDYKYSYHGKQI